MRNSDAGSAFALRASADEPAEARGAKGERTLA
jgi:hypothetical protein